MTDPDDDDPKSRELKPKNQTLPVPQVNPLPLGTDPRRGLFGNMFVRARKRDQHATIETDTKLNQARLENFKVGEQLAEQATKTATAIARYQHETPHVIEANKRALDHKLTQEERQRRIEAAQSQSHLDEQLARNKRREDTRPTTGEIVATYANTKLEEAQAKLERAKAVKTHAMKNQDVWEAQKNKLITEGKFDELKKLMAAFDDDAENSPDQVGLDARAKLEMLLAHTKADLRIAQEQAWGENAIATLVKRMTELEDQIEKHNARID